MTSHGESFPVTESTIAELRFVTVNFLGQNVVEGGIQCIREPFFDDDTESYYQASGIPPIPNFRNVKVFPTEGTSSWSYFVDYDFEPNKRPAKNIVYPRPNNELIEAGILGNMDDFFEALMSPAEEWAKSRREQEQLGLSIVMEDEVRLIINAFERFNRLG
jgi:hypothetical protein